MEKQSFLPISVKVNCLYIGANGQHESVSIKLISFDCLTSLESLARSGMYTQMYAYAPLCGYWLWSRQLTRAENTRLRKYEVL